MALMTIEDLERESKVSRFTWRSWIRAGRIAAVRLGRRVLVEEDEYRRFIRANVKPARDIDRR
jgi:excisionase family DNA binding protein